MFRVKGNTNCTSTAFKVKQLQDRVLYMDKWTKIRNIMFVLENRTRISDERNSCPSMDPTDPQKQTKIHNMVKKKSLEKIRQEPDFVKKINIILPNFFAKNQKT